MKAGPIGGQAVGTDHRGSDLWPVAPRSHSLLDVSFLTLNRFHTSSELEAGSRGSRLFDICNGIDENNQLVHRSAPYA